VNGWAQGQTLSAQGLIVPFRQVRLSSPVEAIVRKIQVKEGDRVEKDQVLAILYSPFDLLEAERADKIVTKTEFEWRANQRLSKDKIVSEDKALASQIEYEVAVLESRRAKAQLEDKTLRAPWAGRVIRCLKEEGETVGRTQELFALLDYSQVYVQVYLEAKYLPRIKEGMVTEINISANGGAPAKSIEANIYFVDPVVDAGSGLFRVKLLLPNGDFEIKPGLPATVAFTGIARD
jgi:membrane fusion protein (multidrug efflux system)